MDELRWPGHLCFLSAVVLMLWWQEGNLAHKSFISIIPHVFLLLQVSEEKDSMCNWLTPVYVEKQPLNGK